MQALIKIVGMLFCFLSSAGLGFFKALCLEKRVVELENIGSGIKRLKEYIENCPAEIEYLYSFCFGECKDIYIKENRIFVKQNYKNTQDLKILDEFFASLGALDRPSETARASMFCELINDRIKDAKSEKEQKGRVFKTCGVCVGLGLVILLI